MSQAGGPSGGRDQIAAANIAVTADLAALEAKLKEAEAKVNASAQKMGAAAKVNVGGTGSTLFPGVNLPGAGGGGGAAKTAAKETAEELNKATAAANNFDNAASSSFGKAWSFVRRFTGALTAAVGAAYGLAKAIDAVANASTAGETNANKFLSKLGTGGDKAQASLKAIADRIQEIDQEIAGTGGLGDSSSTFGQVKRWFIPDSVLEDEKRRLVQSAAETAKQAAAVDRAIKLEENKKLLEEMQAQADNAAGERKRESEDRIATATQEAADAQERMKALRDRGNQEGETPEQRLIRETNEALKQVAEFRRFAGSSYEKDLANATEKAIIDGSERAAKKMAQVLENAFLDAINGALQASGGTGESALVNMVTSLRDLQTTARAIQSSIPRTEAGAY